MRRAAVHHGCRAGDRSSLTVSQRDDDGLPAVIPVELKLADVASGCATLTFRDERGDTLGAFRMARAPEPNRRTRKDTLATDLRAIVKHAPHLKVGKIADSVDDNWSFLIEERQDGAEALDFFHASEHVHAAIAAANGDGTTNARRLEGAPLPEALVGNVPVEDDVRNGVHAAAT